MEGMRYNICIKHGYIAEGARERAAAGRERFPGAGAALGEGYFPGAGKAFGRGCLPGAGARDGHAAEIVAALR